MGAKSEVATGLFDYEQGDGWDRVMRKVTAVVEPQVEVTIVKDWKASAKFEVRLQPSDKISIQKSLLLSPDNVDRVFQVAWTRGNWVTDRDASKPYTMFVMVDKFKPRVVHRMEPGRTMEVLSRVTSAAVEQRRFVGPAETSLAVQRTLRDQAGDERAVSFPEDALALSARATDMAWRAAVEERHRLEAQNHMAFDPSSEYVLFEVSMKRAWEACCESHAWEGCQVRVPRQQIMAFVLSMTPQMSPVYVGVGEPHHGEADMPAEAVDGPVVADAEARQVREGTRASGVSTMEQEHSPGMNVHVAQLGTTRRASRYPRPHGPDVRDTQHVQD